MAIRHRPCPTPWKRAHRDRIAAALDAADLGPNRRRNGSSARGGRASAVEPYECICGRWHTRSIR